MKLPYYHIRKRTIFNIENRFLLNARNSKFPLIQKKSIFALYEGKLLVHVISKRGWSVDPDRVEAINSLSLPSNRKALESFLG